MTNEENSRFEALSPWADIDPLTYRGLSQRLDSLENKKIGLLRNSKRAAMPIMEVIEKKLKERYPTIAFTSFANMRPNVGILQQDSKDDFENWLKGVDGVIAAFGD